MPDASDHRLAIWAEAAAWALSRNQTPAAQRLLVLTLEAAANAGCLDVADYARQRILTLNPRHHVSKYASASEAMTSEEFLKFLSSVRRQLSFEEAERMVTARPIDDRCPHEDSEPIGQQVMNWLKNS